MSALLGALGAGAGGYAEGRMQREQADTQSRQAQVAELMGALQRRSMERGMEDAPPEFMQGLQQSVPGFQGLPRGNREEQLQAAGLAERSQPNAPGLSFEDRMAMIQERNRGQIAAKKTAPGRTMAPTNPDEMIVKLSGQMTALAQGDVNVLQAMMETNPALAAKIAGMGPTQQFMEARKVLQAELDYYRSLRGQVRPTPGAVPGQPAPMPTPAAAPREKYDENGNLIR